MTTGDTRDRVAEGEFVPPSATRRVEVIQRRAARARREAARRRKRALAVGLAAVALVGAVVAVRASLPGEGTEKVSSTRREPGTTAAATTAAPGTAAPTTTAEPSKGATPKGPAAETLKMTKLKQITGAITPKSVVASGKGVVTAQNMMYTHTVTAYDAEGNLVATVPDTVSLTDFGIDKPGTYKGAPVEAAFTGDGRHVYVSNYSMYGPGMREGHDTCSPGSGATPSYLYRIDTRSWKIDQVVPVGAVPKYVAVTPDDRSVLATNWCTYDLTIASTETGRPLRTVSLGAYPRGIVVTHDSKQAYVAVMGSSDIAEVDLASGAVTWIRGVGRGPRHLVLSPDGAYLFATINAEGKVAKIDTASGKVVAKVATGSQPRSMAISTDGTAVYVVNYESNDVTKLATSDLHLIQTVPTGDHPIGITYDDSTGRVWVANYSGSIDVYDER